MPVNQRQFEQLTEMGISLWQYKTSSYEHDLITPKNFVKEDNYIPQDIETLADLTTQKIFTDILQSVDVSIGEISANKDHLDLGLFNWYFSAENHDISGLYCINNNLFSPAITSINKSSELKKKLWLVLANNLL